MLGKIGFLVDELFVIKSRRMESVYRTSSVSANVDRAVIDNLIGGMSKVILTLSIPKGDLTKYSYFVVPITFDSIDDGEFLTCDKGSK